MEKEKNRGIHPILYEYISIWDVVLLVSSYLDKKLFWIDHSIYVSDHWISCEMDGEIQNVEWINHFLYILTHDKDLYILHCFNLETRTFLNHMINSHNTVYIAASDDTLYILTYCRFFDGPYSIIYSLKGEKEVKKQFSTISWEYPVAMTITNNSIVIIHHMMYANENFRALIIYEIETGQWWDCSQITHFPPSTSHKIISIRDNTMMWVRDTESGIYLMGNETDSSILSPSPFILRGDSHLFYDAIDCQVKSWRGKEDKQEIHIENGCGELEKVFSTCPS